MPLPPQYLTERLARWRDAGLLTAEQVDAITSFEASDPAGADAPDGTRPSPPVDPAPGGSPPASRGRRGGASSGRTTAAEAIGYVGAALVLGAVGLFVGEFWQDLTAAGQLALAALVTISLAGAAWSLRDARSPALARLSSVLLVGVVAGVAWCTVIVTEDLLVWSTEDVALASGCSTVVVALPLYLARRAALSQLTLLAALLTLLSALLIRPDLALEPFWYALPYAALGAVWLLLAEGRYLEPRAVGGAAGAVLALLALQCGSFGDLRLVALVLAVAAAGGLVGLAVAGGALHHLATGAVGLFVLVPQVVFELFGDAIGAPATLLLVGVLLVLLAVGIGRARREVTTAGVA